MDTVFKKIQWGQPLHNLFLVGLALVDLALCAIIVLKIPYTEIDWVAYMQEVEGYLNGERNYMNLKGDTGPLVYPAGFVYIFAGLRQLTDEGTNIFKGQCLFVLLYMVVLLLALLLYRRGRGVPWWIPMLLIFSKRIHSIFMLRMFNDCVAVALGLAAMACFTSHRWRIGSVLYSLAVSVKMNMLLYAPGLLMLYLMELGFVETLFCLFLCGSTQVLLGLPFLLTYPLEYLMRAFDLGRVFMYQWTVNWKCVREDIFLHKGFAMGLLGLTVVAMVLFAIKWNKKYQSALKLANYPKKVTLTPHFMLVTLFTSNFLGIAFARSLHYQFYVWYFHSLPYLLWSTDCSPSTSPSKPNLAMTLVRSLVFLAVMAGIEVAFNVFPATWWSSLTLQVCHGVILVCIILSKVPEPFVTDKTNNNNNINNYDNNRKTK